LKKSQEPQEQVISNAGPLIHLAKANALQILQTLYHSIIIPEEVKTEIVDKGKEKGHSDALQIEKAIQHGWIKTIRVKLNSDFQKAAKTAGLRKAEASVVQYEYQNHLTALLDDEPARIFARTLNITIRGTLGILIQATKNNILSCHEAIQTLDKVTETMYISADLYKTVRKEIEKLRG
jgi:predicted nucleic acid-binding protein